MCSAKEATSGARSNLPSATAACTEIVCMHFILYCVNFCLLMYFRFALIDFVLSGAKQIAEIGDLQ